MKVSWEVSKEDVIPSRPSNGAFVSCIDVSQLPTLNSREEELPQICATYLVRARSDRPILSFTDQYHVDLGVMVFVYLFRFFIESDSNLSEGLLPLSSRRVRCHFLEGMVNRISTLSVEGATLWILHGIIDPLISTVVSERSCSAAQM